MLSSSSLQPNDSLVAASLTFCHYVKHLPLTLTAEANVYVTTCLAVSVVHFCADYNDDEQRRVRGGHTTAAVTNVKAPHLALALALRSSRGTLCSEMAEIVQKVALVGYIDFGSSWLLFGELA